LPAKSGAGALRRPILVALGLCPDGKKEIIDFRLAGSESAAEWEQFLTDLCRRGLTGEALDMICVDGGSGLLAALPTVLPNIPVQRCWAHKIRNVLDKVRKGRSAEGQTVMFQGIVRLIEELWPQYPSPERRPRHLLVI
jgi:putative transposase